MRQYDKCVQRPKHKKRKTSTDIKKKSALTSAQTEKYVQQRLPFNTRKTEPYRIKHDKNN